MSTLFNKTINMSVFMLILFQFNAANSMTEEETSKKTIPISKTDVKPIKEDNKERFGYGDSLSSIRAVTGPSVPTYVDSNKVVFASIDPINLPFSVVY